MNIHDLMVGNWVVYNGDVEYINPIKIEGMDIATGMCITTDRDDVGFDGVWPIPLTAEILLKNGFKKRKQGGVVRYILTADYYDVYVTEYPDGWWMVEYDDIERGDLLMLTERIAVRNVHQLQDAFRLFGVEKEFEL